MTQNNNELPKRTIIISGINGDLGRKYAERLKEYGTLYGISRSQRKADISYIHICADFLNPSQIKEAFDKIDFSDDIIYLHLIGKFRFEDENHPIIDNNADGVDDEIFATNFITFMNVRPVLMNILKTNPNSKLKVIGLGSTSDIYGVPFWNSFTAAKEELRKEFRKIFGDPKTYGRVSTLMVNVSTVAGSQLETERPFISKTYCLNPEEVVEQSLPYLLDNKHSSLELSIVKPHPSFGEEDFLSIAQIRERWYRDMYGYPQKEKMKGGNK